jgi:hypothetical protein
MSDVDGVGGFGTAETLRIEEMPQKLDGDGPGVATPTLAYVTMDSKSRLGWTLAASNGPKP